LEITVFDQWNDMLVDGLSTPVRLAGGTTDLGEIAMNQWQANIYTRTFFDLNGDGVSRTPNPGLAWFRSIFASVTAASPTSTVPT